MGQIFTQMKSIMKENGMQIKEVVGGVCTLRMGLFMKESGTMTSVMDREC